MIPDALPVPAPTIYTIGHSNRSEASFLNLLQEFNLRQLVDIRRFAGSAKWPQFGTQHLSQFLTGHQIRYLHLEALGGRRPVHKDSLNTNWQHPSFRAYADYMETPAFRAAVDRLEIIASALPTAIMCAEAAWWRCHRALVADYLKAAGWQVYHIMGPGKASLHPYTSVAKIKDGQLTYR